MADNRPAARRPPIGTALVVSASTVLALTVAVARHRAPFGVDSDLLRAVGRFTTLATVARVATQLGTWPFAGPALIAGGLLCRPPRRTWATVVALCAIGTLGREALAAAIDRPRPPMAFWEAAAGGPSFPSGHTATATLAGGALVVLCGTAGRRGAVVVGALVALVVGVTRVVLRVHWATDVLGGWAWGVACVSVAILVLRTGGRAAPHAAGRRDEQRGTDRSRLSRTGLPAAVARRRSARRRP